MAGGEHALLELLAASHAGNTTAEFEQIVTDWVATAKHPKTGRLYTEMVYQPMLEVLGLPSRERIQDLHRVGRRRRVHASVGGAGLRHPTGAGHRQPHQDEVRSSRRRARAGCGSPRSISIDDKAGKPVGIQQVIGRRPTIAFGNSDGDFEMLEWTTTAPGPRLGVIVHHTDAEREWAYDRASSIGRLERGLDEAGTRGWMVVDMKQDWKSVWPRIQGRPVGMGEDGGRAG